MTIANRIARRLALLAAVPGLSLAFAAQAQTVVYYHTDALGSVVAVTDASRNVIEENEYEPYGKVVNHALQDGPGYTGHVADAQTGLIYMQQRYYDDDLGEFPTVDPVSADSVGGVFNRYAYANNNPYRYYDPDGRKPEDNTTPPSQTPECDAECKRAKREQEERERNSDMFFSYSPPSLPEPLVNGVAGFGDTLSMGASKRIRGSYDIGSVDTESDAYFYGEVGGVVYSFAMGGAGLLNGGAKSVFWSGTGNMERAASMGVSLERTPLGALMQRFGNRIPYWGWKGASCIYACNASGTALKVGLQEGNIWRTIEKPILGWRGIPYTVVP